MKKKRPTNAKPQKCNLCGHQAEAVHGTKHRRCGGSPDAPLREPGRQLPAVNRGTWL